MFLVSHDRRFLDNVVTSLIAWEGDIGPPGFWREYEGGIEDWRVQRARLPARPSAARAPAPARPDAPVTAAAGAAVRPRKLSYKDQRELDQLPARIDALEAEQRELQGALADPALYVREPQRAAQLHTRVAHIDDELMAALERWEALGDQR